jgi:hypothetical protein
VSMNVQPNPFQGAYLLRLDVKKNPPSTGNNGAQPQTGGNGGSEVTQDYIKNSHRKKSLLDHKKIVTQQRDGGTQHKLQLLNQRRDEVNNLHKQLMAAKNPFERQQLESALGLKSAGTNAMEHNVGSSYDGPGGGFVGSENRIDYVGSFVTFG